MPPPRGGVYSQDGSTGLRRDTKARRAHEDTKRVTRRFARVREGSTRTSESPSWTSWRLRVFVFRRKLSRTTEILFAVFVWSSCLRVPPEAALTHHRNPLRGLRVVFVSSCSAGSSHAPQESLRGLRGGFFVSSCSGRPQVNAKIS